MTHVSYSYERAHSKRYVFTSTGKRQIEKVVEFSPIGVSNLVNLEFGDLRPDGSIDDSADSNNGDIIKVLATVITIVKEFTAEYPQIEVFFTGSTTQRTRLYARILKTYYPLFNKEFVISGITRAKNKTKRTLFDPQSHADYLAFLLRRF